MSVTIGNTTYGCSKDLELRAAGIAHAGRDIAEILQNGGTLPASYTIHGQVYTVVGISGVADGSTDNLAAISRVIEADRSGQPTLVVLPPAPTSYRYSGLLNASANTYLVGYGATLQPLSGADTAWKPAGDNCGIFGLRLKPDSWGSWSRWPERFEQNNLIQLGSKDGTYSNGLGGGSYDDAWCHITKRQNIIVRDCWAAGSVTGFIMTTYSRELLAENNTIYRSHSDSIHFTKKTKFYTARGNAIYFAGDDPISTVSYKTAARGGDSGNNAPPSNGLVEYNTVYGGRARGFTVVGGEDILIQYNTIEGTAGAGVRLGPTTAQATFPVRRIIVRQNMFIRCGRQNANNNNSGSGVALLATNDEGCTDISIRDNEAYTYGEHYANAAFVRVADSGGGITYTENGNKKTPIDPNY